MRGEDYKPRAESLPTRGAWIEIDDLPGLLVNLVSLPTRGAWIEIVYSVVMPLDFGRRSPHGERGLKLASIAPKLLYGGGRSPHGERGLKSFVPLWLHPPPPRRSPHGERGLKFLDDEADAQIGGSLPTRGAWIEIGRRSTPPAPPGSLPTRGAWIEMGGRYCRSASRPVAPHTGSVD